MVKKQYPLVKLKTCKSDIKFADLVKVLQSLGYTDIDCYLNLPWHYSTESSTWEGEKGYWVSVAELPECSTFAPTLEEGLKMIPNLLREYLKIAIVSSKTKKQKF